MIKVNLNFQIKNLDGISFPTENDNASKILASALAQRTDGPFIKVIDWAQTLWKKKPIEIDESDRQLLIAFVEGTNMLNALCKAQILPVIREAKDVPPKEKK